MAAKKALARELVGRFHSPEAAVEAEVGFKREVQSGGIPLEIPEVEIELSSETEWLPGVLTKGELTTSSSGAIRLIRQGAVRVDGERITDKEHQIPAGETILVRVGKRRYKRIVPRKK
jgi:tyrosyl-tRNA synthetase